MTIVILSRRRAEGGRKERRGTSALAFFEIPFELY